MQYDIKNLPKALKEVKITVSPEELKPFMEETAGRMSQQVKIEGFRPGKASYELIKARFGEMAILEEALPSVVQKFFMEVQGKEKIETVGEPRVNVEKAAPGNEVVFAVTVAILPHIHKMPDISKIKVKAKDAKIEDKEVERVVDELRKMQSTEHDVERAVGEKDKVVVDMTMTKDLVVIEGGAVKDHAIYLDEPYYVPGLNEKLQGMKAGENKKFKLKFPKEHYQKHIAGADVDFDVTVKKVQEIRHPEASDDFAKKLGKESLADLRDLLRKNLENEAQMKETQRQELAVLEELIKDSKFDDIPEMLVNAEAQKMLAELEHEVTKNGADFDEYLKQIKKTKDNLLLDFTVEALKRVKGAIVIREVAIANKIEPDEKMILDEQLKLLNMYKDDADTQARIRSEDGEAYIRNMMRNRKVMEFLRTTAVMK